MAHVRQLLHPFTGLARTISYQSPSWGSGSGGDGRINVHPYGALPLRKPRPPPAHPRLIRVRNPATGLRSDGELFEYGGRTGGGGELADGGSY